MATRQARRDLAAVLAFLAPNILGFLTFTFVPLLLSLIFAFSNYDLRLHNRFRDLPLRFALFENFSRLLKEPDFWRFLGNTLFLMLSVPFGIAGSLAAALLLNRQIRGSRRGLRVSLIVTSVLVSGVTLLILIGAGSTALTLLLGSLACGVLVSGTIFGTSLYRTLFYIPSFTSGVAVYLLWTKLYNPQTGPINVALRPALRMLGDVVNASPPAIVRGTAWVSLALLLLILWWTAARLRALWSEGELGTIGAILLLPFLVVPAAMAQFWLSKSAAAVVVPIAALIVIVWNAAMSSRGRDSKCASMSGIASTSVLVGLSAALQFGLLGLAIVLFDLPSRAKTGLEPPAWLVDYYWAKPAIMIMGFWAALGSNNMLLYLAALSNVPLELYEAAKIDGAGKVAAFWNVTWPQLATTTFFIVVMSTIGGLQGGFDSARSMTSGGPAGSTTTLAYYIYSEGFLSGHLGYASAIAWVMFLMTFAVTLVNWRLGSGNAND